MIFEVPEFEVVDPEKPVFWAVHFSRGWENPTEGPLATSVKVMEGQSTISELGEDSPLFLVMNITKIVARVDEVLSARLKDNAK